MLSMLPPAKLWLARGAQKETKTGGESNPEPSSCELTKKILVTAAPC